MTDWILHSLESTPPVLAIDLQTIDLQTAVFIVVVVVSLLGRLFGRKEDPDRGEEWFDDEHDESARQQQPSGNMDWEEQMRRLLGGESPQQESRPAQRQVQRQPPALVPTPIQQTSAPPPLPVAQPISSARSSDTAPRLVTAADLAASKAELAAARAKATAAQAKLSHSQRQRTRRPQTQNAIQLLRSPETAQQAILAAEILGKPKGFN
ncbi:MAG: hypothetical protein ACPGVU_04715 [Limisphaerales bacterium]